jgi:uncharacterized protein
MKYLHAVLAAAWVACAGVALAQNDPSAHQIYETLRAGHIAQAQQMVDQVLRDHPRSGEAHYVAAEVYAREGDLGRARQEFSTAEQLRPGLPFASPRAVQELRSELTQAQGGRPVFTVPYSRPHSSGIPWAFILIVGAGIAVLWMVIRRRAAASTSYQQYAAGPVTAGPAYGPGYGPGGSYGPGYGPGYGGPGVGSGIAGGLASGLAVGAGVVAGEELARHFLDGGQPAAGVAPPVVEQVPPPDPNADMGGTDFGLSDSSSWDDGGGGGGDFGIDSGGGGGGDDWT